MATLTYHRKPNGTTYVYRQESYWEKSRGRSATRQVCIGKLGGGGEIVYNRRFSDPAAREALERGETISESTTTGQSLILAKAASETGLDRVLRLALGPEAADVLLSSAYAVVAAGDGTMYAAPVWIEDNDCPAHANPPTSQSISRMLASLGQDGVDSFRSAWIRHRHKGTGGQYCFDITSISSHNMKNPFVEWGHNRDCENLAQINLALLTSVATRIPTYYEILPGSMSDVRTIKAFCDNMKMYGTGRIAMLLDRGFYSEDNLNRLFDGRIGFLIPVPANVKWAQRLIDGNRDSVEMPEHVISVTDDRKDAVYGMTLLSKMDGRRVWQHVYYDTARRAEHILAFFDNLSAWEEELAVGDIKESNQWAYDAYFTVKTTPKRGRKVTRRQDAISSYKTGRAGYWVILTNCEKSAARALAAYRQRSLVEQSFDDMKNELDMKRLRTHGQDTMRGRVLVQFLALIITAQIRSTLDGAWARREELPKGVRLSRRYSLKELMLRLGSYRRTRFSGRYGEVVSTPTKAQREIFTAFGLEVR
jgi:transposase